jgi:hypothetical protein
MKALKLRGGMIYEGASMMLPREYGIGVHPLTGI